MRALMNAVSETLDPTAKVGAVEVIGRNKFEVAFKVDGRVFAVRFSGSDGDYYMSFTGTDDRGRESARILNHGKPFSVFSGVVAAMLAFARKKRPDQIEFSIDGGEVGERGPVYDKLLDVAEKRGLLPQGYVWDRDGNHNYFIFKKGYR